VISLKSRPHILVAIRDRVTKEDIKRKVTIFIRSSLVESSKLLLGFASTVVLVSGPVGTHDHVCILSRVLRVFKWGVLYEETRGLTTASRSLFISLF
jgi:hypothetical protein